MIVNMVVDRKENKTGNVAITLDDKTKFIINYSVDKKGVHIVYNGNKKLLTKDDINVLEDFIWAERIIPMKSWKNRKWIYLLKNCMVK